MHTMAGADQRTKDAAMAARLKSEKVERKSANCPMCHHMITLAGMYSHIVTHKGGSNRHERRNATKAA